MKITRNTTIKEMFALGFTEMYSKSMFKDEKPTTYFISDFEEGGKMEKFADYSIARFEYECDELISFGI